MDHQENKQKSNKVDIWSLLIGVFLIFRGGMRVYQGELEWLGGIMLAIGIASIVYFFMQLFKSD